MFKLAFVVFQRVGPAGAARPPRPGTSGGSRHAEASAPGPGPLGSPAPLPDLCFPQRQLLLAPEVEGHILGVVHQRLRRGASPSAGRDRGSRAAAPLPAPPAGASTCFILRFGRPGRPCSPVARRGGCQGPGGVSGKRVRAAACPGLSLAQRPRPGLGSGSELGDPRSAGAGLGGGDRPPPLRPCGRGAFGCPAPPRHLWALSLRPGQGGHMGFLRATLQPEAPGPFVRRLKMSAPLATAACVPSTPTWTGPLRPPAEDKPQKEKVVERKVNIYVCTCMIHPCMSHLRTPTVCCPVSAGPNPVCCPCLAAGPAPLLPYSSWGAVQYDDTVGVLLVSHR